MTKVKICGIVRTADAEAVNELSPDYVGFVFYQKSRRCVSEGVASKLREILSSGIKTVGVFVDEEPEVVARLLNEGTIDMAQLHGKEDENYLKRLRKFTNKPIIKAFFIKNKGDLKKAEYFSSDYILLDSGAGTGTTFDWKLLKNFRRRYFLAGGLTVGNVAAAIDMLNPYAVDVSSGVETGGLKDFNKMADFISAVRKVDAI